VVNTVNIMESNAKRGMEVIAEIVSAADTSLMVTMVVVADATNIMEVWGSTDGSYPATKSSQN